MEAGLDSLGAVELRTSLETAFAMEMPATITFDYPTIGALAKYIAGHQGAVRYCKPLANAPIKLFLQLGRQGDGTIPMLQLQQTRAGAAAACEEAGSKGSAITGEPG